MKESIHSRGPLSLYLQDYGRGPAFAAMEIKKPSSEGAGMQIFSGSYTRKRQGLEYPAVGFVMIQAVIKANHR